jgi:hypothetical protein
LPDAVHEKAEATVIETPLIPVLFGGVVPFVAGMVCGVALLFLCAWWFTRSSLFLALAFGAVAVVAIAIAERTDG